MLARRAAPLLIFLASTSPALATEDKPAVTPGQAGVPDSFCPQCRRGVSWDDERCPACKTEFEPLRPRARKGEGSSTQAAESPFTGPPQGAPADKVPPGAQIIPSPWRQIQPPAESRFGFGSYGRVGFEVRDDLEGPLPLDLVDFRPRLGKDSYQELHFFYKDVLNDLPVLVKSTLAFDEKLFHYDGDFDARMALRELYAEVEPTSDLAVWIGARMYRGDDIYLFDFWPLDDQNTLGGGAALRFADYHRLQAHVGVNRIVDEDTFFQFQEVTIPLDDAVGERQAVFLDRNRGVVSLTYALELPVGLRAKIHGEGHYLPPGARRLPSGLKEKLPADHGFLMGGQLGYRSDSGALAGSFANLFVRYATGLGAFDELSVPFGFDTKLEVEDAERLLVGLGGAIDSEWAGAHYGAYWQQFEDADSVDDRDDSSQYAFAVRPMVYLGRYFRAGFEVSHQVVEHRGVFIETGDEETMQLTKFSLLAGIAPRPGLFARPELLAFFSMKWLNKEATLELGRRRLAEVPDREEMSWGLLAEWWF